MSESNLPLVNPDESTLRTNLDAATNVLSDPNSSPEEQAEALKAMISIAPALGNTVVARHRDR
jgi:hypothetical protein